MFELAIRVVFSLAVILGLLWFIARTSSRRFGGTARSAVRVVARQPLARSASLAVVEVGDRVLVVGVSEHGVNLLTEMDPAELPEPVVPAPTTSSAGSANPVAGSVVRAARSLLVRRPGTPATVEPTAVEVAAAQALAVTGDHDLSTTDTPASAVAASATTAVAAPAAADVAGSPEDVATMPAAPKPGAPKSTAPARRRTPARTTGLATAAVSGGTSTAVLTRPQGQSALSGSVLSAQTWRQAWAAATRSNGIASD